MGVTICGLTVKERRLNAPVGLCPDPDRRFERIAVGSARHIYREHRTTTKSISLLRRTRRSTET